MNNNRTYHTVGVRGFNLPTDYGSRILVLVNGHNMADNIFDSMLWFGVDFPIDLKLMQRIEVIRGPSSALYGSSGVFATINIITKSPDEVGLPSATARFDSFGEKKLQVMGSAPIGRAQASRSTRPSGCTRRSRRFSARTKPSPRAFWMVIRGLPGSSPRCLRRHPESLERQRLTVQTTEKPASLPLRFPWKPKTNVIAAQSTWLPAVWGSLVLFCNVLAASGE